MKTPRMANAVGHIDDDLVVGAAENKNKINNPWAKWGSLAACFIVLAIVGSAILPSLLGVNTAPGGVKGRYKDFTIYAEETALVWPWEYRTVYEKYTRIEIDGIQYQGKGRAVSETLIGERIGSFTVAGYDEADPGKSYTAECEAYRLRDIAQSQFIAVRLEGNYYVFQRDEYAPPSTLGELMDAVGLSKVMVLDRFSEGNDNPDNKHFVLDSDDYVWEVLSSCRSAAFVEDQMWTVGGRKYLSFTITSEALGVYKAALYVTEDGYLWTNAFGWQYLFDIGEEAAGRIIGYAKENSANVAYEPYRKVIMGVIADINAEYILVDDSILCRDPKDGITYKVLLNDLRISRYAAYGVVKVGDTVQISFEGEIDEANTIDSAISVSQAMISGEDVFIPE